MTGLIKRNHNMIVLAAVIIFLLHCVIYLHFTVDDSFISYRFARNWAEGFGPVYNSGDRVEGYTSFAWVALLAAAHRLGFDIEAASKTVGILSGIICIIGVSAISCRLLNGRLTYLIAPLVLALSPLYAAWACSGMEATLFSAAVVMATYALLLYRSQIPLAAVLFGLCALIRPEGVLFGAVAFASILGTRDKRTHKLFPLKWALTFCALFTPYLFWRTLYYGSMLPNTYYAKTGRGLERLLSGGWCVANFAEYQGLGFTLLCIIGFMSLSSSLKASNNMSILSLSKERYIATIIWFLKVSIPAFLIYIIWAGGDILHIRFFIHIMGFLAVCAAVGFDRLTAGWRWNNRCELITVCLILAISWLCLSFIQDYRALHSRDQFGAAYVVSNSRNLQNANIPLAKWLNSNAHAGDCAAVWDIGALGYYSKLRVIDMYGLADYTMARLIHSHASDARKAAYVMRRRPEFIIAYAKPGKPDLQWFSVADNWVRQNYRYHSYWRGGPDGYGLALLVRQDINDVETLDN